MENNAFPERLRKLGFSETPRSYMEPEDSNSADWLLECYAWVFTTTKTRYDIQEWIAKRKKTKPAQAKALLDRINRQRRMIAQREQTQNF